MVRGTRSAPLWAAVLVVTMGGLYVYGLVSYEPESFRVVWTTDGSNHAEERFLRPGQQASFSFMVPSRNLTSLAASLTWTDDVGAEDRFVMNVTGPFGEDGRNETRAAEGAQSPLAVQASFLPIPSTSVVRGADAAEARERLGSGDAPWRGDAFFNVTIRLAEANGEPGLAAGIAAAADPGNQVRVSVSFTQYRATLTPHQ